MNLKNLTDKDKNILKITAILVFAVVIVIFLLSTSIRSVHTGEVGIKTRFGKIVSTNLKEGLQVKAPWEEIVKMNIKVQKYENTTPLETSTKDLQLVSNVIVAINYQIDEDKAVDLYRQVGEDYTGVVLEPAIQEVVKSIISQYRAEELVNNRSIVSDKIQETLIERISSYGIKILSISLKNFDFSEEYNKAIEQKTVAEQEALTAQQKLETAKAQAEKKKIEAQAEADANKILEQTLTDKVLKQQFIEKWNGELPKVTSDGNIFDVSGLLK